MKKEDIESVPDCFKPFEKALGVERMGKIAADVFDRMLKEQQPNKSETEK